MEDCLESGELCFGQIGEEWVVLGWRMRQNFG
jgi:hypothetical protein